MPLSLVIEDGTLVADATSYGSVGGFATFAALRGVAVDTASDKTVVAMIAAMDLIANFAGRFVGERCSIAQALDWPRRRYTDEAQPGCPAPVNVALAPPYVMPAALVRAQYFAALASLGGTDLQPIVDPAGFLAVDKTGPLSQTYQRGTDHRDAPTIPQFRTAIESLCRGGVGLIVGRA